MKKLEPVRLYNFSDANLIAMGREKVGFMQRDATEFIQFGIMPSHVAALNDAITDFVNTVTDTEALSDQTGVTTRKDAKAEQIRVAIRSLMARVKLCYGADAAEYRKFGTDTLSLQSDAELFVTAREVVRVGNQLLSELEPYGVTTELLDSIATFTDEFENTVFEMKMRRGDRDILQEDRVEAGNEVYSKLVLYAGTGRTIWETTDVAKYNDYIIYNTFTGEPPLAPAI